MFKSEFHNFIGNIVVWLLATIILFTFLNDNPLWFKILLPLIMAISVFDSAKRAYIEKRDKMIDSDSR